MPPVRTLLFLVPLVKALRPRTMPAKQLSTASSMKARVASQKAGPQTHNELQGIQLLELAPLFFRDLPTVVVCAWHLWLMQNLQRPWLAELPEYRYCIQKSVAVETTRSTRVATPHRVPPPAKVYSIVERTWENTVPPEPSAAAHDVKETPAAVQAQIVWKTLQMK